jgi:hypothetical protein
MILGNLVPCDTRLAWLWIGATYQPVECLVPAADVPHMKNRLGMRDVFGHLLLGVSSRELTVFQDRAVIRYHFLAD